MSSAASLSNKTNKTRKLSETEVDSVVDNLDAQGKPFIIKDLSVTQLIPVIIGKTPAAVFSDAEKTKIAHSPWHHMQLSEIRLKQASKHVEMNGVCEAMYMCVNLSPLKVLVLVQHNITNQFSVKGDTPSLTILLFEEKK